MIYLETERLILRDYEKKDEAAYIQLKSDSRTMYYLQDIRLFDKKHGKKDFEMVLDDLKSTDRQFYFLHVELKESHQQVGSVGYTTEAFRRVIEFAFLENGVYRITTGCLTENIGSEKVMQKCGLIKEAEKVKWEWHEGAMKDRVEYRLLRDEWKR